MTVVKLHPKLKELKQKAAPINYRALAVDVEGQLVTQETDLDKRIIKGYLVIWNQRNMYGEVFIKGAFAKSIKERGPGSNAEYQIKFFYCHKQDDALALFDVLKEDEIGLYFETAPLDDVPNADRTIKQIRSKTLNNFSIGFDYVWDKMKYDDKTDSIFIYEAELYEGSVVGIPADMRTYSVRSLDDVEDLYDDSEDFISTLPRRHRMQARELFARHKSLINLEPLKTRQHSGKGKPVEKKGASKLNIDFIIKNL